MDPNNWVDDENSLRIESSFAELWNYFQFIKIRQFTMIWSKNNIHALYDDKSTTILRMHSSADFHSGSNKTMLSTGSTSKTITEQHD